MEAVVKDVENIDIFHDRGHDALYISFGKVQEADDSELTDNDIIIRYRKGKIIGVTVLEFSKRIRGKTLEKIPEVSATV
jgi:uncharacterized protein YuzE